MTAKNAHTTVRKASGKKAINKNKAPEALGQFEEKYRLLFDAAPMGIGVADIEGNILDANRCMEEMTGYTLEELKKTGVVAIYVDPQERNLLIETLQKTGEVRDYEVNLKRKDGTIYSALINVDSSEFAGQKVLLTMARDITKSKRAEEALKQSEEKYRMLVENIQDGVFIIQDEKFQYVNEAYASIAGFTKEEMIGADFRELIAPEDLENVKDLYFRRLNGDKVPDEYEVCGFRKDGTKITASMKVGLITFQGRIASMGIARDITERKRAEMALKTSEKKYSTLVEKGNDGIVIVQDGRLKFANSKMVEITGFNVEDAMGKPFIDFISPDFKEFVLSRYKKRMAGEHVPNKCEIEIISRDSRNIPVEVNASLIEYDGRLAEMGIIRDITERKRAEKALEAAIAQAEEEKNKANAIISAIGDGIIIQDTDYKILYQNQVQIEAYGDRTGEYCYRAYENRDTVCEDCPVELSFRDGKIHRGIRTFATDKGMTYFELTSSPLMDSKGKIIAGIKIVRDITESKRSEEALRKSEDKYRTLFETMAQGVVYQDADGKIISANPAAQKILGLTLEKMTGRTSMDPSWKAIHEDGSDFAGDTHPAMVALKNCIEVKNVVMGVFNPEKEKYRWINVHAVPQFRPGEDRPFQVYTTFEDITEHREADDRIRLQSQILETMEDGVNLIRASDNIIVYTNPGFERMFGYEPGSMIGLHASVLNAPAEKNPQEIAAEISVSLNEKGEWRGEIYNIRKNGTKFWCSINISAFQHPEHGKVWITVHTDITERKRMEEELNKSKQLLERTFSSLSDAVFIIDSETAKIIDCNKAASTIFGYDKEEMIGRITAFLHVDEAALADFRKQLYAAAEEKGFLHIPEFRMKRKNGDFFFTENTVTPLVDDIGKRLGWVSVVRDITERKATEEALRESEEKFRGIFEQSPIAIELYDREGKLIDANRSCLDLFGVTNIESVKGFKLFDDPNIPGEAKKRLSNGENTEYESIFDFELVKKMHLYETIKSGKCYINVLIIPLMTEEREPAYLVHVRNITERKRVEEKLREGERFLANIFESIQDGIGIIDKDLNIIRTNPTTESWYPHNMPLVGKKCYEAYHGQSKPCEVCPSRKTLETGESTHGIVPKGGPDGEVIGWLEIYSFPMIDTATGQLRGAIEYVRDITERKRVEVALQESETRYRTLFENAVDAIFILDAEGKNAGNIVAANQAAAQMHGYSINELLSMKIMELDTPDVAKAAPKNIRHILGGERIKKDIYHRRKDGTVFPVEMNAGLLELGNHKYILAFDRDITERKLAEEAIKKYTKELEESKRLKELFIDIMHHDLINPLSTSHGYIELLMENETSTERMAYLDTIKRNLIRGTELIDSATRYSKLENVESIELEYMDLKVVIDEVIETLVPLATKAGMRIENNISLGMPAKCNKIIQEVFDNFISNAIKYASKGGKVLVSGEDGGGFWRIKVTDFGEGISDTDKTRIFERFSRMEKRGVKGSGLGLAIVRRIVELHNGRIHVEDNPEGGAIFIVDIPKLDQVH
ncbi:MAG TPA: PAS domain S-box protein [Candidatus Methanoperedens sp.]